MAEIETQFIAAEHLRYATRQELDKVYVLCDDISRMLTRLRRSLEAPGCSAHRAPRTADH